MQEKSVDKLDTLYKTYISGKCDSQSNLFYAFTVDKLVEIQDFLHSSGYKELLMNEEGIYFKKADIFRSVCIDKICTIVKEDENAFLLTEQYVFLGKNNFHKPDIALFYGYTEEKFDDYVDVNMTNPYPNIIIEVIDVNDIDYVVNLLRIYRNINLIGDLLVFFLDPIKKELYVIRSEIQQSVSDKELLMYLGRVDYFQDIQYKNVKFNFERILSKQ